METLNGATLADRAYAAIRAAITSGEFAPGQKLTERELAAQLSVSLTPVREAIRRLEQEHLVERISARTTVVFAPPPAAVDEFALMEASLRALAVRFATLKADRAVIAQLEQHLVTADELRTRMIAAIHTDGSYPDAIAESLLLTLREFHADLEAACGNAVLLRMLNTVTAFNFRQRADALRRHIVAGRYRDERYFEHHELLAAVRRGDADEAERLMLAHGRAAAAGMA